VTLTACVNRLQQTLHSNGFCLEWLRRCIARSSLLFKHLPHSVHLYLLVWIFICRYRAFRVEKRFSHWVHECNFFPVCLLLWSIKFPFVVNRLLHTVHRCGLDKSSRGCSVISLLSIELSPVQYTQHASNILITDTVITPGAVALC